MAADTTAVLVDSAPFVLVVEPQQVAGVVVAMGSQGPPGRNGVDGAALSPDAGNQLENRENGLYVPPATWQTSDW